MPTLEITNFNLVVSVLGGWVSLFGLVSYLLKENFYLSEARESPQTFGRAAPITDTDPDSFQVISLLAGVTFSPHALNWVRPLEYAGSQINLDAVTLYFTRLVLGVQLVLSGIQLPSRYLKKEWKPLALLLGPIMTAMWLTTSLLVWALVPHLHFLHALAIGACVTPTDPVLSNVIVKGKFADNNVPKNLQKIIIAESGANDGLGYPFLFLALWLIKYVGDGGHMFSGGGGLAIGLWFGETWGYTVILSVIYGAVVGWLAKELLHYCEDRKFVDRESFLVFAISLALFITGTCGLIGSDDILSCFIAGNVFTWDDWFRLETLDELAATDDRHASQRLDLHVIEGIRHAIFMGFFGPIGCSAIFYLYVTNEFIDTLNPDGGDEPRSDVANIKEAVSVIVWFMVVVSVVVHGLSIPLGKLGFYLPRTFSRTATTPEGTERLPFQTGSLIIPRVSGHASSVDIGGNANTPNRSRSASTRPVYRIGGSVVPPQESAEPSRPGSSRSVQADPSQERSALVRPQPAAPPPRTIRFPDEVAEPVQQDP
ncbi:hypothetical protein FHL15_002806 [Xylaria flabelliformis]|uniref:Cation/H+ exchanger transmembrane domain-containing protein n=1 Tax=Xylaria flabelliformis TaxID=2512241 RepID=A0A553I8L9_9PEZI|nr:hypothetical protein FHL15_002806 [Xylaria flabelliformis]